MITRPLDLASRLQPAPRSFDALFYVNVGLIALFFTLFGSDFVLAPGIPFQMRQVTGAQTGALPTTSHLTVLISGQILTERGLLPKSQLPVWLRGEANKHPHPALLITADPGVAFNELMNVMDLATKAGFTNTILAANEPVSPDEGAR